MIVLYPIKPIYVEKILSGEKIFELRKRLPKNDVKKIVIYATSPESKVVAVANVRTIHTGEPKKLWKKVASRAGIELKAYKEYFDGCDYAHAIELECVSRFSRPFDISQLGSGITVPQSFCYLAESVFNRISKRKRVDVK